MFAAFVHFPPAPDQFMTHLAVSAIPADPDLVAVWGEMVTDEYDTGVRQIS